MAVRVVKRRSKRRLIIDIRYTNPDGTPGRYRHDAEVQTMAAARAEERRRLAALVTTGSPAERPPMPVVISELCEPPPPAPPAMTFASVAESYFENFAPSHLKPSTEIGYRCIVDGFLVPRIGKEPIDRVDALTVRELDAELVKREVRPATRRQMQCVLRSVLCRYAVEAGLIDTAPAFPRLPKAGGQVVKALTDAELDATLSCSRERHRLAFLLGADAGLRAGEIRGLRWRDVDLEARQLTIREAICRGKLTTPKSGHERAVPLTDRLVAALEQAGRGKPDAYVAQSLRNRAWSEFALGNAFRRACGRAGLTGWHLHDLRHYFVTSLFRAGVSAPTVQALAGHANLTTTQRYAHVVRSDLREAINLLRQRGVGNSGVTEPIQG